MKLFPYLFQFLSGENTKAETEAASSRQAGRRRRRLTGVFLIGVRSPNDQQHLVAIPSCASEECPERDFLKSAPLRSNSRNRETSVGQFISSE
jgi:hypothetical protein